MNKPFIWLALLFEFFPLAALAQRDASVWYFGFGAGIDFTSGTAVPLADGAISQPEGCASIADPATGELLFYTDGMTVWNRLHQPMPGGRALRGHESATQSALIVPAPCDGFRFYVFTADVGEALDPPNDGIHYSIVDMRLAGGLGDVATRNVPVHAPASEKLVGVRHANGVDFWIIFHEWQSNLFRSYLLTENGLEPEPVRSYIGTVHEGFPQYAAGYLKASPDGRWLASVMVGSAVELFTFDARTGLIDQNLTLSNRGFYGLTFSPDSRLLYVMEDTVLYQYHVAAGSRWGITASKTAVGSGLLYAMQLAPDGRIYIVNNSDYLPSELGWMPTIDQPDVQGVGCAFNRQGFQLAVDTTVPRVTQGLPNMIDSFMEGIVRPCGPPQTHIAEPGPLCAGSCADFRDASRNLPTQWEWSFPGGTPSSSTEQNPTGICYAEPGSYDVTLRTRNRYGFDSTRITIVVAAPTGVPARLVELIVEPGDTAAMGVFVDAPPGGQVDSVTVVVSYERSMMSPVRVDPVGALLSGWTISDSVDAVAGTITVIAVAAPGAFLAQAGRLFDLEFATWIGDSTSAMLPVSMQMSGLACGSVIAAAGRLELDLCAIDDRRVSFIDPLALSLAHPNPFHEATTVRFVLPAEGRVRLTVHDATGNVVALLLDAARSGGEHEVLWRPDDLPAGLYRCQLICNGASRSTALVHLR